MTTIFFDEDMDVTAFEKINGHTLQAKFYEINHREPSNLVEWQDFLIDQYVEAEEQEHYELESDLMREKAY